MNVLTVSHLFPNKAEPLKGVFVAELVTSLYSFTEGYVIAPIAHFPILKPSLGVPEQAKLNGIPIHHPRYLTFPRLFLNFRWRPFRWSIRKIFNNTDALPDIIHSHWLYPDAFAVEMLEMPHNIQTVVTIHGHASLGLCILGPPSRHTIKALNSIDRIIAVSDQLRDILITSFDINPEKIRVIHNGIDPKKFAPSNQEAARRKLGLALNRRIVICVARLSCEKRIDLLIDAVARCKTKRFQVIVIGNGPLHEELEQRIADNGMENRIILKGGIPHETLVDWYNAADLFCLTSANEGCPVVIHEALACGIPVVSTRVGAVPDLIKIGETGLLTDSDAESISTTIDEALGRQWDRALIATQGQKHTWDTVARQTIDLYQEMLAETKIN